MIPIGFVRGLLIDVEKGVVKEVDIDFTMKKLVKMLRRKDLVCSGMYIQGVLIWSSADIIAYTSLYLQDGRAVNP